MPSWCGSARPVSARSAVMLWVSAVSRAPLLSDDTPRRAASTARSRARSRWLSSSRSDSATRRSHLRLLASTSAAACAASASRRRFSASPATAAVRCTLPVGAALVDQRQRARDQRGGEEDRHRGERPGEPAPSVRLAPASCRRTSSCS